MDDGLGRRLVRTLRPIVTKVAMRPLPVLGVVAILIVAWALFAPHATMREYDDSNFRQVVASMRSGRSYYAAYAPVYKGNGTVIGCSTAFRPPLAFEFWSLFPVSWLYGVFLVTVVGGTAALIAFNTRWPWVAIPVALYLVQAGHAVGHRAVVEQFLDVELWTVPLLALAFVLYRRRHTRAAVVVGVVIPLVRELGLIFLLAGLFTAIVRRLPKLAWLLGIAVTIVLLGLHYHLASQHTYANGICVKLFGTGHPPHTVLTMMGFPIPRGVYLGVALWLAALWEVIHRGDGPLAAPLLLLALTGAVVTRNYWGFVFIPFQIWWACEASARLYARVHQSRRPTGPPPGTDAQALTLLPPRTPS
jgi:hypothetical protein